MLKRLSISQFLGCVIEAVEGCTGYPCHYDMKNVQSPFYGIELVKTSPQDTKTMFVDCFEVWIHAISEPVRPYSPEKVLELVRVLEEAMADDIELPEPFFLHRQEYGGLQTLKCDPSGEGHAVLSFKFHVCYGFRCK